MQHYQKTIKKSITFSGIGVHSGVLCAVTIVPAPINTGIVLRNADQPSYRMQVGSVMPEAAMHATVIKTEGWFVSTIEHVMAALSALAIDNAFVDIAGPEAPILDGSSLPFVQGIFDVGLEEQLAPRQFLTPVKELAFTDDKGRWMTIGSTHESVLSVEYSADFSHPLAGPTTFKSVITPDVFATDIAPARTFGFLEQLPFLRQHNLARGSSLSNTIVIGEELMNDMRFPDECVRHKVLDLIGDLSLLGKPLLAKVKAHKTSHSFNRLVTEHFLKHPDEWMLV
jgi:UDP-3-O-[3-hydroxymyristoyl] N-acetylglucosamine deacetylase